MAESKIPTLRLKVFRGEELLVERDFSEPAVSIGRSADALLRIDDPSVGDLHAVLNVEDNGKVQLLDLGTEAGTRIHGEKVANIELSTGDVFELGNIRVEVHFDEAEGTTPTVDVRPEDVGVEAPAGGTLEDRAEDLLELVLRSSVGGEGGAGPKVLEVHQIWKNALLDTKHFDRGQSCEVGDAVGDRWELLGITVGWVPKGLAPLLRISPPLWSDVHHEWRNDFYVSDDTLPPGTNGHYVLFEARGNQHVARIPAKWDAFADIGEQRFKLDELVANGKATRNGDVVEVPITDDLRLMIDDGGITFFAHNVRPSARAFGSFTEKLDYVFLGTASMVLFLGVLFGIVVARTEPTSKVGVQDIPERYVELLLEKPQIEKAEIKKDEGNKDAGEGAKAKGDEGRVGKPDAKLDQAKGNKREFNGVARDKEIAENAGLAGALGSGNSLMGSNLDAALMDGIGGLIGAKGTQIGPGGLGGRGNGLGGGGSAEGLGGLGTKGMGAGASGFGSGGGSFGAKGSGGLSASTGDPIIMGALDRSLIDAVIKRKMSQIRYCYQRELQKDPSLAGKVVINFTIAKDGTVSQARVKESSMGSKAVDECIVGRFRQMQFPEPKGGGIVIVNYPFIFSPG